MTNATSYTQLKEKLTEIFQLDQADLDFGLYRIMNQKRDEITQFLDEDLLPQVKEILVQANPDNNAQLQVELDSTLKTLDEMGVDPETSTKVRELKAKIENSVDLSKLENEIYSDLYNFFKRYYDGGDFMSLRRYKEGVYAMPYEGEEVKLHWANHDQYYIKTAENLNNYTFKAKGKDGKQKTVRFELASADTEKNNNKATEGKERRFLLHEDNPLTVVNDEMTLRFEFRGCMQAEMKKTVKDGKEKFTVKPQGDLNNLIFLAITDSAELEAFGLKELAPTEKKKERTLLEKHLTDFTAKNSFDYFIHKDLGKFLGRELDFFIKNEIMHLDDIENDDAPKVETYLSKIKALRKVAVKIITFLSQLEDFQKKLWLKKKFVLESHYCITLDHLMKRDDAEEVLGIIASNEAQREEWVELFKIDTLEDYSTALTADFLRANDKLQVDTKFYDAAFKYRLLSGFGNLDEQTDGLMINSENFQALNLMQERYREKVKCIYIDPPYNTGDGDFNYKDGFKSSSWISFINSRIESSYPLLSSEGVTFSNIDENEMVNFNLTLNKIYGDGNYLGQLIWQNKKGGGNDSSFIAFEHEYIECFSKNKMLTTPFFEPYTEDYIKRYNKEDKIGRFYWDTFKRKSGKQYYPITCPDGSVLEIDSLGNPISWLRSEARLKEDLKKGEVKFEKRKDYWSVLFKQRLPQGKKPRSILSQIGTTSDGNNEQLALFKQIHFSNPKPVSLVANILTYQEEQHCVMDYFAGSGTTGHAVINLNREDQGKRKYILVEMGTYFNSVTKPRVQKVAYSNKWKDGSPQAEKGSLNGVSHLMKYMSLEQYEDTLDNLVVDKTEQQASLLAQNPQLKEDYLLSYMMEFESKQSLLNLDGFENPFDYTLRITRDDDTQLVKVDLVETFNYFIGLEVETLDYSEKTSILTLTGKNSHGEKCLILWRDTSKVNAAALDKWFTDRYSSRDLEFDAIYVNGDNHIENLKTSDDRWKVRLTEIEFQRLMFAETV